MTQIFLFLNIGLLKCSICILILRIKDTPVLNWCLYIMMGGLILTNMLCVIVLLAECSPVQKYWLPDTPGKCWDTRVRIYSIYVQVGSSTPITRTSSTCHILLTLPTQATPSSPISPAHSCPSSSSGTFK